MILFLILMVTSSISKNGKILLAAETHNNNARIVLGAIRLESRGENSRLYLLYLITSYGHDIQISGKNYVTS